MKITPVLLSLLVSASVSYGFTTIADFNSVSTVPTTLNTAPANTTGTGFSGGSVWNSGATTLVDVVSGDLSAPVGTNYNRPQSTGAGPRKALFEFSTASPYSGTNSRAVGRDLEGTVDSGVAWISFLIYVPTGVNDSFAAVSFNNSSANASLGTGMIVGGGSDGSLYFSGNGMAGDTLTSVSSVITANANNLILARLDFDSNTIDIWANPDVDDLGAADLSESIASTVTPGLTRLTVGGSNNAELDNLLFSSDSDGYFQVTGTSIPEPSAWAAIMGGLYLGLAAWRRRR